MTEKDIVFETDHYWVKRVPKGFEVYKTGLTHSTRVAVIGYTGDKGLQRAKLEAERREAASGGSKPRHATKKTKKSVQQARDRFLADRPTRSATVLVYSRPSGYWYAQARDATTGAMITDASGYSRDGVLRELRGKFPMIGVTIKSITDEDPYAAGHSKKAGARAHHATKKSPTQLDREIAQSVGKRIDRKKLGEMMSPWGADTGSGLPVYAVSSYYYAGKVYPDRKLVERAIAEIERDVPRAERGEAGWTKADAKDLRRIAQGLRYYLLHDYKE